MLYPQSALGLRNRAENAKRFDDSPTARWRKKERRTERNGRRQAQRVHRTVTVSAENRPVVKLSSISRAVEWHTQ